MAETYCPYCYSKNISKVAYCFRGVNKYNDKNIDYNKYLKENTILAKKKRTNKQDFDGEKIIRSKSFNRYCNDCNKMFSSMKNMIYIDIKKVTLILGNNKYRKKYIFDFFDDNNSTYSYFKNYICHKNGSIDKDDIFNILSSLKTNKTNKWKGMYGNEYFFDDYYWLLKVEYYNGISNVKSGNDEYPNNWNDFISVINIILNKYSII